MKRALLTLSIVTALLAMALPVSAADDEGSTPPVGHTNCTASGWYRQVDVEGATFNLQTNYAWACDDGEVQTVVHSESYPTPTRPSTNRHCRSHTTESAQHRAHKVRYVTRLITDCDNRSAVKVLSRTRWHHR